MLHWAGAAWCFSRFRTLQLRATLKTLLGLLSLSRARTSACKNSRSTTRVKSRRRNRRRIRNFLAAFPIRKRFYGCGIASSSLSETFNGLSDLLEVTPVLICSYNRDGELLGKGEKNGKERVEATGIGGRSSDDDREHFRRQFIWPVGTIKLFLRDHVKNNTAESILLEQRDYVRHPLDAAQHSATDDLRGEMKGNRKPEETTPLDGFRSFRRLLLPLLPATLTQTTTEKP